MKAKPRDGPHGPVERYSVVETLVLAAVLTLAPLAVVVAVTFPVPALLAVAVALAGRTAVGVVRRRRRTGRARTVCVPQVGVCLAV